MKNKNKKIIYFLVFFLALSAAFPAYIRSSFLEEFAKAENVGFFFMAGAGLTLLLMNLVPLIIKRFTNFVFSLVILIIEIGSIFILINTQSKIVAFISFTVIYACVCLLTTSLDIFLERFTSNRNTGRVRSIYFTILDSAWVISPIIVGYIMGSDNYRLIYKITIFFLMAMFIIIFSQKKVLFTRKVHYDHHHSLKTLKTILKNSRLKDIFFISFVLEIFFSVVTIYMPLYLSQNLGYSWTVIGAIFTFMLLPFVIFQIPAGIFADRRQGERKMIFFGFLILSVSTLLFFFTGQANPIIWALILFLSRSGAALVQSMRESYFFKCVDVEDIDYINFFRNLKPLGFLFGSLIGIIVLNLLIIEYIFIILSIILFLSLIVVWQLKAPRDQYLHKKMPPLQKP
ncbi:MAG: MFS transporter [Patescibacteria group bacterium]|nr:MFS transporter [Patescibacteria group bacterium]